MLRKLLFAIVLIFAVNILPSVDKHSTGDGWKKITDFSTYDRIKAYTLLITNTLTWVFSFVGATEIYSVLAYNGFEQNLTTKEKKIYTTILLGTIGINCITRKLLHKMGLKTLGDTNKEYLSLIAAGGGIGFIATHLALKFPIKHPTAYYKK